MRENGVANDGNVSRMVPYLRQMGMSDGEIQAFVAKRSADTNPSIVADKIKAMKGEGINQVESYITQNALANGLISGPISKLRRLGGRVAAYVGEQVGIFNTGAGTLSDIATNIGSSLEYGGTFSSKRSLSDELRGVSGQTGHDLDQLSTIGQAQNALASLGAEGSTDTLDSLLQKGQYSGLNSALKGISGNARMDRIRSMASQSLKSGLFGAASIAARIGMSEDEVMKNPEKFTRDPATLKALKEAGGDRNKVRKIIEGEVGRLNGGSVKSSRTFNLIDDFTNKEYSGLASALNASNQAIQQTVEGSTSDYKYGDVSSAIAEIDKQSANTQMKAADINMQAALINREAAMGGRSPNPFGTNTREAR